MCPADKERFRAAKEAFLRIQAEPEATRDLLLDRYCGTDTQLRHLVKDLLVEERHVGGFLTASVRHSSGIYSVETPGLRYAGD
jgi:hypothetical protein